jgi:hypothetical protein
MATTFRNGKLFCTCCGKQETLKLPMPIMEMTGKIEDFDNQHQSCEQTWAEPTADPSLPEIDRAFWWLENGERGLSSETMWHCFMNRKSFPVNHPHDAGDFSRCYKLLQAVPEWKHDLGKLP